MKWIIKFEEGENITSAGLDGVEYAFPFTLISEAFVGKPEEKSQTKHLRVIGSISRTRNASWQLSDEDLPKVLFEFCKRFITRQIEENLLTDEDTFEMPMITTTSHPEAECPFDPLAIPPWSGQTIIIEAYDIKVVQESQKTISMSKFHLSKTAETILSSARRLAHDTKRGGITSSCVLFALVDEARTQHDTAFFVRESLSGSVGYLSARNQFNTDNGNGEGQTFTDAGGNIGKVSNSVLEMLNVASEIAAKTTPQTNEIHARHLFAALIASASGRQSVAHNRLEGMGVNISFLRREFYEYLQTSTPSDSIGQWKVILTIDETADEPNPSSEFRSTFIPASTHIDSYALADQPTAEDALGYDFYAKTLADFLRDKRTGVPLTISVEGEWGAGKSCFLLQVERELRTGIGDPSSEAGDVLTVWFNPWKHDVGEALWAAFAVAFEQQMLDRLTTWKEWLYDWIKLTYLRMDIARNWPALLRSALSILGWGIAVLFFVTCLLFIPGFGLPGHEGIWGTLRASWVFGLVGAFLAFGKKLLPWLGNPITADLKKLFANPNYADKVAGIENFHRDFRNMVAVHGKGRRIAVFIDDLDRCEVPKAAELLQSLQLLMSPQDPTVEGANKNAKHRGKDLTPPKLIFVLGIDRETVAAGIAAKHEKLWPYLIAARADAEENATHDLKSALRFGFEYLEKFIDVTLRLPKPDSRSVALYLEKLCPFPSGSKDSTQPGSVSEDPNSPEQHLQTSVETEHKQQIHNLEEQAAEVERQLEDTGLLRKCAGMASPLLDYNPRRIKQFVNTFRLRSRLSPIGNTIVTRPNDRDLLQGGLNLPQIAKLVAIELAHPLILEDWYRHPDLFVKLTAYYLSGNSTILPTGISARWTEQSALKTLILNVPREEDPSKWSLTNVDQARYLAIAPRQTKPIMPMP